MRQKSTIKYGVLCWITLDYDMHDKQYFSRKVSKLQYQTSFLSIQFFFIVI